MERRTEFLTETLLLPGSPGTGEVWRGRAETIAREDRADSVFDLVTSRSFAAPGVTAECAARFLVVGGLLIVSEPPDKRDRWPEEGLAVVGLSPIGHQVAGGFGFQVIQKIQPTPDRYPRAVGRPGKSPLF